MDKQTFKLAAGLTQAMADRWFPHITAAWAEFGIATPARQAAWLGQIGHESAGFVYTREIWGPTPAQTRYEGRADLGNTQPGDGKRFMGRGLIQVTGRANYRACGAALGIDLEADPTQLQGEALAARSACWFWQRKNLNALADAGDFVTLTRRINGGTNGLADRQQRWERAKRVLGVV
ncbi:glycoside hydrolase family 19 protein [Cupriavidus sp. DL-D2]|uniref:glycoside hydrolase family 19 protein n=1 Tax=Cupriavidus sp. DL-D2 TaxID=3144974 RepID=UPI00321542B6